MTRRFGRLGMAELMAGAMAAAIALGSATAVSAAPKQAAQAARQPWRPQNVAGQVREFDPRPTLNGAHLGYTPGVTGNGRYTTIDRGYTYGGYYGGYYPSGYYYIGTFYPYGSYPVYGYNPYADPYWAPAAPLVPRIYENVPILGINTRR